MLHWVAINIYYYKNQPNHRSSVMWRGLPQQAAPLLLIKFNFIQHID
jgi:hypothetical protein